MIGKSVFFDVSYVTEPALYRGLVIEGREAALRELRVTMKDSYLMFGVYHSELESLSRVHVGCGTVGPIFVFTPEIASAFRLWRGAGPGLLELGFVKFVESLGLLEPKEQ